MKNDRKASIIRNFFKSAPAYFTVGGRRKELIYFLKMGNVRAHIVDRIKFKIFPKFYIVPKFPTHLDIETASACQMRCPMCYTTHLPDNLKGVMKLELYRKIIDQAKAHGVYSIKLSWRGEPLLNRYIVEMVRMAKQIGIKEVAFLTNGALLKKRLAENLVDAGLDWMSISADGVGEVYNKIRYPAIFEETVSRVRYIKDYRDQKGLKTPLLRVQSIMSAVKDDPKPFYSVWEGVVDRINLIADQARDFEVKQMQFDPLYFCAKPWQRMSIAHDGRVHQCNSDYAGMNIMGDANTDSLIDIWHDDAFEKVRRAFRRHTYLADNRPCSFCTECVVKKEEKISIDDSEMTVRSYTDVKDVVSKDKVVI